MSRALGRHRAGTHRAEPTRRARAYGRRTLAKPSEPTEVILQRRQQPDLADARPSRVVLTASSLAPSLVMNPDALHADGFDWCGWDWCDHYHASIEGSAPELLPAYLVLDGEGRVYLQGSAHEFRKLCARILAALPTTTGLALLADAQARPAESVARPPLLRLVR